MRNILTVALFLLLTAGTGLAPALPQEEDTAILNDISGQIVSVDKEKSSLVVKELEGREATIYVDISTVIEKGDETITPVGLAAGDNVDIEYAVSENGENVATYIWVNTE